MKDKKWVGNLLLLILHHMHPKDPGITMQTLSVTGEVSSKLAACI